MSTWNAQQGGSTDVKVVTIENVADYTDYYGHIAVVDIVSKGLLIGPIAIAADSTDGFTLSLMPVQTELLSAGKYLVVFEISKGVDPVTYRKEISWLLEISSSLINV